jgi:CO/xanthine dehydrogenase Mo-binding subunit
MTSQDLSRSDFLAGAGALVVAIGVSRDSALAQAGGEANPVGGADYPNVDSWIALDAKGGVLVAWGKVEQGTGIQTALAQLVADELDVPFASITVLQGDTDRTPDQGYTAGSQSLMAGALPVRKAAAQARARLIELAAMQLSVSPETLSARDGAVVSTTDAAVRIPYAKLVPSGRIDRIVAADIPLKPATEYRVVGRSIRRVDIPGKVNGTFNYVQDVRVPGMWHARMVHPQRLGQVASRVGASSLGALRKRVRIVHEHAFVAVAAEREWDAVAAARQLKVEWAAGAPLPTADRLDALLRSTPATSRVLANTGDVSSLRGAGNALRATYHWPFQSHGSIGSSCAIADVRSGRVTIWSGTEGTHFLQRSIAALLGRDARDVVVKYVEASGAYGHNGADDAAAAAAVISARIGKPVRLQYMRLDETAWDPKGPAMLIDLEGIADAKSGIAAWSFHGYSPSHVGRPNGEAGSLLAGLLLGRPAPHEPLVGGDRNAKNNYDIANQHVVISDLPSAALRTSSLRGLGGTANTFANESFIDELAHAAQADPIAFRLAHLSDPRARAILEALRPAYQPGRGVAFVRYENTDAYLGAVVDLVVNHSSGDVRLRHVWVAHDCGLIVNPDGLRNQIEGNVVQGCSRALLESVTFDADGVTSVDWMTYPILTYNAIPSIDITLINRPDRPIFGAGEATTMLMAPAIANAIFAQTGVRLRSVPFTTRRVKAALASRSLPKL